MKTKKGSGRHQGNNWPPIVTLGSRLFGSLKERFHTLCQLRGVKAILLRGKSLCLHQQSSSVKDPECSAKFTLAENERDRGKVVTEGISLPLLKLCSTAFVKMEVLLPPSPQSLVLIVLANGYFLATPFRFLT